LRLSIGAEGVRWPTSEEVWRLRIDRVVGGIIVGAALALAGAFVQTLLRNPLASPDLIGPTSGAGFAVMLATLLAGASGAPLSGPAATTINTGAAIVGAVGVLGLVYVLSQRRGSVDPIQLVLVGVIVSVLFGAGSSLLMQLMPDRGLSMTRWTIGALSDETPRSALLTGGIIVMIAAAAGIRLAPALDAATLSDEEAISLGIPIRSLRIGMFFAAGGLTAAAVVIAGPVGFVGLISPHIVRLIAGASHRVVVPLSAILGAAIIIGADTAVRLLDLRQGRIPMGVITAIAGGAVFIWMLRAGKGLTGDHRA
jgi:iron complex transport system permease protein